MCKYAQPTCIICPKKNKGELLDTAPQPIIRKHQWCLMAWLQLFSTKWTTPQKFKKSMWKKWDRQMIISRVLYSFWCGKRQPMCFQDKGKKIETVLTDVCEIPPSIGLKKLWECCWAPSAWMWCQQSQQTQSCYYEIFPFYSLLAALHKKLCREVKGRGRWAWPALGGNR